VTGPSCSPADPTGRLVVVDHEKTCLEFHNKQTFYRVIELLENSGREYFIIER
jgi:ABC-type cobalamin transport system ATPase subunit